MKQLIIKSLAIIAIVTSIYSCKTKTTAGSIPGTDLAGHKNISAYNALEPDAIENLEVYHDETLNIYFAYILPGLGNTPGWQGWDITKGTKGYKVSPTAYPSQALDIAKLTNNTLDTNSAPNMSTYNSANSANYEFTFEPAGPSNIYYIKSNDGKYFIMDFANNITTFVATKPTENNNSISRFKIM